MLNVSTTGDRTTNATCSEALGHILALTPRLRYLTHTPSFDRPLPGVVSSFSRLEQLSDLAVEPSRDVSLLHASSPLPFFYKYKLGAS